jgi:hypothetical protein
VRGVRPEVRDLVSLVAGAVFLAVGALLVLDQAGAIELTLGWVGAVMAAALGAILVASGLTEPGDEG